MSRGLESVSVRPGQVEVASEGLSKEGEGTVSWSEGDGALGGHRRPC